MHHAINPGGSGGRAPCVSFFENRKWILAGLEISIILARGQFEKIPLPAVMVVVVYPVVNLGFHIFKRSVICNDPGDFVLHMPEETFLRCVVPAVAFSGHGLHELGVFQFFDERIAGIVASLIAVYDGFIVQYAAMFCDERIHGF